MSFLACLAVRACWSGNVHSAAGQKMNNLLISAMEWGIPINVKFKRMRPHAALPRYMTAQAAGMDMYASNDTPLVVAPFERCAIPLGWAIELPPGTVASIRPRSGLAKKGLVAVYGTIDADYRGELAALVHNVTDLPFAVQPGDRIAQLVVTPVLRIEPQEVEELDETARGDGGFGSTGVRG